MSTLRQNVADYLQMRQTMGFKAEGLSKLLKSFVSFCEARGVDRVRNDIVLQWATTVVKVPVHHALFARRMDAVRIFAKHQHTLDPATQIPSETAGRRRYQHRDPNVFTPAQITALMAATDTLSPQFRALTWRTLIGLLAATGMRPGEACRLSVGDIDLAGATIKVLATKFDKSRLVFIHPTTVTVLEHYLHVRRDWAATEAPDCPMVFLNTRGGPIDPSKLATTFNQVADAAGLTTMPGRRPPRLHDLRHTFAVTTLLQWYRDGHDVQSRLPLLSTWLGHVDPASTYWYLHAVPELLNYAAHRLEAQQSGSTEEPAS